MFERIAMSRIVKSRIADLMVWGSLPLWGVLDYTERKLSLSDAGHKWFQAVVVVAVAVWVFIWFRVGEFNRLAYYKPNKSRSSEQLLAETEFTVQRGTKIFSEDAFFIRRMKDDVLLEMMEKPNDTDR